jgi:hypothetical protein
MKMETQQSMAKKGATKGKVALCTALLVGTLYAGDKLHVNRTVGNAYAGVKNKIVDIFTYDVGERAIDLSKKIEKEKNIGKYVGQLEQAAIASAAHLPDNSKEKALERIINGSSVSVKESVLNYSLQSISQETKTQVLQENVKNMPIQGLKALHDFTDQGIEIYDRQHATGLKALYYKAKDAFNGLKDKVVGEKN